MNTNNSTRTKLVTLAQHLIQARGYNGFSYRDLAEMIGIRSASIHYYFPQKEDLLLAAIDDYRARWREKILSMPEDLSAAEKLWRYFRMYVDAICRADGLCLGGTLAADFMFLPETIRKTLQDFYLANENWLTKIMEEGNQDGTLQPQAAPQAAARALYAAIQGALISSRLFDNSNRLLDPLASFTSEAFRAAHKLPEQPALL
jgi:TetR/AcrR family transcriptional repressor of nem operon